MLSSMDVDGSGRGVTRSQVSNDENTEPGLPCEDAPRRVRRLRQFSVLLYKNFLLQTRSRKVLCGLGGWAALAFDLAIPQLFFLLMCIPKYYFKPMDFPLQTYGTGSLYTQSGWSTRYHGPAARWHSATIGFVSQSPDMAEGFAKAVACDAQQASLPVHEWRDSFQSYFLPDDMPACRDPAYCSTHAECYNAVLNNTIRTFQDEAEAVQYATQHARTLDAVVVVDPPQDSHDGIRYRIRTNHTVVPATRQLLADLDLQPDKHWRKYWFFANLELQLQRAFMSSHTSAPSSSNVAFDIKQFPWPQKRIDVGAGIAAVLFNLLLVFAFLLPSRSMIAALVREKELRLREGMRILGLKESAYWLSWAMLHFALLAVSALLCSVVGLYPFSNTSFVFMLAFLLLSSAALIAFSYFLSTLFSASNTAATVSPMIYAVTMIPGFLMPTMQPYGGGGWVAACLLPPSALSMFASVLIKLELGGVGLNAATFYLPITQDYEFSAASVFGMMAWNIPLYAALAWYFDKIMPRDIGQRQHPLFVFMPSYWSAVLSSCFASSPAQHEGLPRHSTARLPDVAIRLDKLRKEYHSIDGSCTTAVDDVDLDVPRGRVMALLGHNGAGKTTTIGMLTGMLQPTSGTAYINGLDIRTNMDAIRNDLGVCPQFDILWPDLTVREHLELYAAIKGFNRHDGAAAAAAAAGKVALHDKLDSLADELSGGQRRKLSVAIAFLGSPAVVFLDEPTSGMDPHSRQFTWEVIRQHGRRGKAIVLTTHSMKEADVLCDRIAIMAAGRVAAVGSSLELKTRYGVGYVLTIVKSQSSAQHGVPAQQSHRDARTIHEASGAEDVAASHNGTTGHRHGGDYGEHHAIAVDNPTVNGGSNDASDDSHSDNAGSVTMANKHGVDKALTQLVKAHVPDATMQSSAGAEVVYQLPRQHAKHFPALLREIENKKDELGVSSYGLSITTLEQVFLNVSNAATMAAENASHDESVAHASVGSERRDDGDDDDNDDAPLLRDTNAHLPSSTAMVPDGDCKDFAAVGGNEGRNKGLCLFWEQLWALFIKRMLCARRERLVWFFQLFVPLGLLLVALWIGHLQLAAPHAVRLHMDRSTVLMGKPIALAASAAARQLPRYAALAAAFEPGSIIDTGKTTLAPAMAFFPPPSSSLDAWLLQNWYSGQPVYGAVFIDTMTSYDDSNDVQPPLRITIMVNQTAMHGAPAVLSMVNNALLRCDDSTYTGAMAVDNEPLPTLRSERSMQIAEQSVQLVLILLTSQALAVLSATFAVFVVRERVSTSKHVQLVSGVRMEVYWMANLVWDYLNHIVVVAAMLACFWCYGLPQFSGRRLAALSVLLAAFGAASVPKTYAASFMFGDEMKALIRTATLYWLLGYLGFVLVFMLDIIVQLPLSTEAARNARFWRRSVSRVLWLLSPHYCASRGMYEIGRTYPNGSTGGLPTGGTAAAGDDPFGSSAAGHYFAGLAFQTVLYCGMTYALEAGWLQSMLRAARRAVRPIAQRLRRTRHGTHHAVATSQHGGTGLIDDISNTLDVEGQMRTDRDDDNGDWMDDEDVEREAQVVGQSPPDRWQVMLRRARKTYDGGVWRPPTTAVASLSLAVGGGECFGLLGTNGAGKTTTFRMLTGEIVADDGEAYVAGHALPRQVHAARRHMGYCPQLQGLPGNMTGREVLVMYARLRGMRHADIMPAVDSLLKQLGLSAAADAAAATYSGGMRRKLSVAIALMGAAAVVFLDEPSTGLDPGARRFLWNVIQQQVMRRQHTTAHGAADGTTGGTVVLTSHSMEECEALCTRIVIMIRGRARCIGTAQHLKNRFGSGYSVELQMPPEHFEAAQRVLTQTCAAGSMRFTQDVGNRLLLIDIAQRGLDLPAVLEAMDTHAAAWHVENYSISQTTLEQVFLRLTHDC